MDSLSSRFALRLALPALGLGAILALAEPLPADAAPAAIAMEKEVAAAVSGELADGSTAALQQRIESETRALRADAQRAEAEARDAAAAAMRLMLTVPGLTVRLCDEGSCSAG